MEEEKERRMNWTRNMKEPEQKKSTEERSIKEEEQERRNNWKKCGRRR
jgi:hypothetical protein